MKTIGGVASEKSVGACTHFFKKNFKLNPACIFLPLSWSSNFLSSTEKHNFYAAVTNVSSVNSVCSDDVT